MSNFKTPVQRLFEPVISVATFATLGAGCVGAILFLIMLALVFPAIIGAITWFVLDYFGSPYSIEIAVIVAIATFLFGSLTRVSMSKK